ncbi:MAG: peptide deformylase [Anaerolineae bacterium]|jgi:peptide deformylase|nr:peptide deformylase [Anaerolineae bacterium]MBT3712645.1 peptide deformylase [Anaerolineae bacterium]MBT4312243.1 peptide deformylase [Anaerolineae bacterium]MBT6060428.1 peptide deformylase [Anaerolineae bacterium]MBT6322479.1 peptide deformylase [Anaerolineae bacterium]
MTLRKIITVPNEVLRRNTHIVTNFDKNLKTLIDDMVETMRNAPGVGLAAPQIGILEQIVVIEFGDEEDEEAPKKLYTVVNPEITRMSNEKLMGVEGCLSVPGVVGDVERSLSIVVKGQNRNGQKVKYKLSGWVARIFQHEIDHLTGVLFTDLAESLWQPEEDYVDNV